MKRISIIVALITITLVIIYYFRGTMVNRVNLETFKEVEHSENTLKHIQENSVQAENEKISDKEREYLNTRLKALIGELKQNQLLSSKKKDVIAPKTMFWLKLAFSVFFGLAAMFIVLSKKYDDETKKWAFSVLTLISGVWIGTVS